MRISKSAQIHRTNLPYCHPLAGDFPPSKVARFVVEKYPPGERCHRLVVDAGCGEGRDTASLLEKGFRVVALDASERNLEVVHKHPAVSKAADRFRSHIVDLVGERMPVMDGMADVVLDVWVLGSVDPPTWWTWTRIQTWLPSSNARLCWSMLDKRTRAHLDLK